MSLKEKFIGQLQTPTHGHVLGLFRIIFGSFMVYEMVDYFQIDLIKNAYLSPKVLFTYDFFEWLQPLPEPLMNVLLGLMLLAAIFIALGLLFRPACLLFGILYLYFFLLDKGLYNNHIYLFILLSFLLSFTHADDFFSLKSFFRKSKNAPRWIPQWEVFIFQLQFAIVYFYGGLVKLNSDWLVRNEPMQGMIKKFPVEHWMAPLIKQEFMVPLLTYGGVIFDLAVPFLLWKKSTRKWALIPIVLFHLPNSQIFGDIGIFPFIMLLSTVLFFEVEEIPFLKNIITQQAAKKKTDILTSKKWVPNFLIGYFIFQLLFPFRGFFLPNNMDWTSVANRFSWRMKIQSRDIEEFSFYIQDGPNGAKQPVLDINNLINPMQILKAAHDVRCVKQTAEMLAKEMKARGMNDPLVTAQVKVKWNGRSAVYTVDPKAYLNKVDYSPVKKLDWVMPPSE